MYDKVLGCILGAAVGDAMGAPTEGLSTKSIQQRFGGRVTDFFMPPDDGLAHGRGRAQVTDAFSIPYLLTEHLIRSGKEQATRETAKAALIEWGKSEWFEPFAGMTTRKVVKALMGNTEAGAWAVAGHLGNQLYKSHYYALSSNGAAVKAYPAALLHPNDQKSAVQLTVELTMASHDDVISIAGAAAVAAAVSCALGPNANVQDVVEAALYGLDFGMDEAEQMADVWHYPGPSVKRRMLLAIEIAATSPHDYFDRIRAMIGSGPAIAETVPCAIGLFVANNAHTMNTIADAVNVGDETSAIACIAGALCGAFHGKGSIPEQYLETIESANGFDIQTQARNVCEFVEGRKHYS